MKIAIIIILYNKEIYSSVTLMSLLEYERPKLISLYIINNGPNEVSLENEFYQQLINSFDNVIIENHLNNKPLSKSYNDIISNDKFERYLILDDDTWMNNIYLDYIVSSPLDSFDVCIPRIKNQNNNIVYPVVGNMIVSDATNCVVVNPEKYIYTIASGLAINKTVVNIFNKLNLTPFDERYALYGVDISFFRRLQKLKNKGNKIKIVINSTIEHSLSSVDVVISDFRYKERLIDLILSTLYYSRLGVGKYIKISYYMMREIFYFKFSNARLIFKVVLEGKHPRC
ncbi:glycosyltransferase family 2 protein [Klebsiella pneumoniae]|uniref:glycosyltransferase family 2 protein n=1 Tax=Klebsiella pneumoniae TaxID=573 RepID=UPI003BA2D3CE